MSETQTPVLQQAAFQLKGSLYPLTVLHLFTHDLDRVTQELKILVQKAPKFFQNTPVIIDLKSIQNQKIDFPAFIALFNQYHIVPLGVRNGSAEQLIEANKHQLPTLQHSRNDTLEAAATKNTITTSNNKVVQQAQAFPAAQISSENPVPAPRHGHNSKFIAQNIRSGQQIYAPGGDLIILGSVSPGAELLADGNIHVYGALRGRALAGIQGNKASHIFCLKCEAELISISGIYRVKEDIPHIDNPTHIFLELDKITITDL
jgi:septum site-determining protein MinC